MTNREFIDVLERRQEAVRQQIYDAQERKKILDTQLREINAQLSVLRSMPENEDISWADTTNMTSDAG